MLPGGLEVSEAEFFERPTGRPPLEQLPDDGVVFALHADVLALIHEFWQFHMVRDQPLGLVTQLLKKRFGHDVLDDAVAVTEHLLSFFQRLFTCHPILLGTQRNNANSNHDSLGSVENNRIRKTGFRTTVKHSKPKYKSTSPGEESCFLACTTAGWGHAGLLYRNKTNPAARRAEPCSWTFAPSRRRRRSGPDRPEVKVRLGFGPSGPERETRGCPGAWEEPQAPAFAASVRMRCAVASREAPSPW